MGYGAISKRMEGKKQEISSITGIKFDDKFKVEGTNNYLKEKNISELAA